MPAARRGMRRTARRTSRRTSRRMDRRQSSEPAAAEALPAEAPAPAAPPPEAEDAAPAYMAELEQLSALHTSGILSDEEFEAKKQQILGL